MYITNPVHGGKVTCHKCLGFILEGEGVGYHDHQHRDECPAMWFHKDCYDPDVDYWCHVMN
jgi:hypothetical protein